MVARWPAGRLLTSAATLRWRFVRRVKFPGLLHQTNPEIPLRQIGRRGRDAGADICEQETSHHFPMLQIRRGLNFVDVAERAGEAELKQSAAGNRHRWCGDDRRRIRFQCVGNDV